MSEINHREKLRQAREKKGWSIHEAATQVKAASITSRENYYDIETHDDELTYCYSLSEISRICRLFDISPHDLFCSGPLPQLTIEETVQKIRNHCVQNKITTNQFENIVGWRIESCLSNPKAALDEWCLDCLKDVCQELQIDWHSVVSSL